MQTFLPYPEFQETAKVLDYRRLGKQRVETWQIVRALNTGATGGWTNHPATKMWLGYENALCSYGIEICQEWILRGYVDHLLDRFINELHEGIIILPPWLGNEAIHASHRSNLLRKDSEWYGKFNWIESNDLPYVWPV